MHHEDDIPLSDEERALAERGAELVANAVAETSAPQSLREAIERDRMRAAAPARAPLWRRRAWAFGGLATLAVATLGAVAVLSGGGGEPTLAMIEAAAAAEPTEPAPELAGGDPPVLAASVDAIEFPDWRESFDWRAVGRRDDELDGREVTTVYYENPEGATLGYAVLDGEALDEAAPGREVTRNGNSYTVADRGDHTLVTWTQEGQTCVIAAAPDVSESTLVDLAASRDV